MFNFLLSALVVGLAVVYSTAGILKLLHPEAAAGFMHSASLRLAPGVRTTAGASSWVLAARCIAAVEIALGIALISTSGSWQRVLLVASAALAVGFLQIGRLEKQIGEDCGCLGAHSADSSRMSRLRIGVIGASLAALVLSLVGPDHRVLLWRPSVLIPVAVIGALALLAKTIFERTTRAVLPEAPIVQSGGMSRRRVLIGGLVGAIAAPLTGAGTAIAREFGVAASTSGVELRKLGPGHLAQLLEASRQSNGFAVLRRDLEELRSEVGRLGIAEAWRARFPVDGKGIVAFDMLRLPLAGDLAATSGLWWTAFGDSEAAMALAPSIGHADFALNGVKSPNGFADKFAATPALRSLILDSSRENLVMLPMLDPCTECGSCKGARVGTCAGAAAAGAFCCILTLGIGCIACAGGATAACGVQVAIDCNNVCVDCADPSGGKLH